MFRSASTDLDHALFVYGEILILETNRAPSSTFSGLEFGQFEGKASWP